MALTGDPIEQEVFQQLQRREEVYSQQNNNSTLGFRSNKDLFYLNSSNAWVRLISGADVLNPNTNKFDSQVAQQFVLWGGEASYSKFPTPNWKKEEGINFTDSSLGNRKTYNFDEQLGIRPQAGITSFSIKSRNRFGSIRQANIGFKVWTKSDLELAQTLFLKPGIPVILEWGRTPYLDNEGNLSNYDFKNSDLITFFNKVNFERVLDLIDSQRKQHSFNYDGFLGLVSNFSFNLTSDGAFDCTLTVVSQGMVLESLTTQAPSTYLPEEDEDKPDKDKTKLHRILYSFESKKIKRKSRGLGNTDPLTFDTQGFNSSIVKELERELVTDGIDRKKAFFIPGYFTKKDPFFSIIGGDAQYVWYITLRNFLAICNISFSNIGPENERLGGASFALGPDETPVKYNTFKNHFSFNPLVAIIPKTPSQPALKDVTVNLKDPSERLDVHGLINENLLFEEDNIMEIRISTPFLIKTLEEFFSSVNDPNEANVLDYVRRVLNGVKEALGGINDFDIFFDEDSNLFRVVDREVNPYLSSDNPKPIPLLNATGLKTQVLELSVQSKISSELSSMIAIAAQASDSTSLNKDRAYLKWMDNSRSRFRFNNSSKDVTVKTDKSTEESELERFNKFIDNVNKAYREFNGEGLLDRRSFDTKLFDSFQYEGVKRTKEAVSSEKENKGETNGALIPIELSLKLTGISGIKIGQIFQIANDTFKSPILPDKYNSYGFIVTSLGHSVANNKWITELGGILFKVKKEIPPERIPGAGEYLPLTNI